MEGSCKTQRITTQPHPLHKRHWRKEQIKLIPGPNVPLHYECHHVAQKWELGSLRTTNTNGNIIPWTGIEVPSVKFPFSHSDQGLPESVEIKRFIRVSTISSLTKEKYD
jgi:hypothetical protein